MNGESLTMNPDFDTQISSTIGHIDSLSVISGYYLVLGGGKVGNKFVEYAKRKSLPFVLVIDIDCEAPASKNAQVLPYKKDLIDIISSLPDSKASSEATKQVTEIKAGYSDIYFYCMDVKEIPSILEYGIPEYIVPAIPSHAAVDIVVDLLHFDQGNDIVKELSISEEDSVTMAYFENIISYLPEDIIAGKYPEHGAIFLSYARSGDICPDNCRGPEGYCYTFKRVKPRTITSYVRELSGNHPGWVFDSCQMGPGIGGIRGKDLKENLVSLMGYIRRLKENPSSLSSVDYFFFVATTCNCHGILNILKIV